MRIKEGFKTAALIVLTLSMFLLFFATWSYSLGSGMQGFTVLFYKQDGVTDQTNNTAISAAAYPIRGAANAGDGLYGACGGFGDLGALYERIRPVLAEAVGSASDFTEASESQFRAALFGKMAYVFYNGSMPLFLVGEWLGVSPLNNPDITAGGILLSAEEDNVVLYCRDSRSGEVYSAKTAAMSESLLSSIQAFAVNGCEFAASDHKTDLLLLPESILFPSPPELQKLTVSNVMDGADAKYIQTVLTAFEYNPYTVRKYEELNGTQVYVGEESTLSLYTGGNMRYLATNPDFGLAVGGLPAADTQKKIAYMVEAARSLIGKIMQSTAGDAGLEFSGYKYDETADTYLLTFDYVSEYTPVVTDEKEHAFTANIKNGKIYSVSFVPRRFQKNGENTAIIPQKQAAAAIRLIRADSRTTMTACYRADDDGVFKAKWNYGEEYRITF